MIFPPKQRAEQIAFSMIEVMIAVGIFSLVMVSIYASWTGIMRGTQVGRDAAAAAQRSRMALRSIEDALTTAELFTSQSSIGYYSFVADTSGDYAGLSLVSHLPDSFPGSGLFGNQPVRRVSFSVEAAADSRNQLIMRQVPVLLSTNSDNDPYSIVLGKDVSRFDLEFWDERKKDWVIEFLPTNQFPKLMRVTLGLGRTAGASSAPLELVSRVIAIPSTPVTPEMQMPFGGGPRPGVGPGGRPMPINLQQPPTKPQ
jgi:type II secretory pathway pseudopilin PulG